MTSIDPSRRRFLLGAAGTAALAVAGGGLLAACGSDDGSASSPSTTGPSSSTTGSTPPEPATLTAMMPFSVSLGYVLHLTAKTRGYFDDESLTVDVQFARGAGQALQALLAGQVQLAQVGVLNLVPAVADQGAEAVAVAMPAQKVLYRLLSSSDAPVRSLDDLVGKRVGLPSLGGNAEDVLRQVLQEADIDPASVELVPAGFDAAAFGLVEQGEIDAMWTNTDIAAILAAQGADVVTADIDAANPLHGHVLAVTDDYLADNRDVVVRYLRAVERARADVEDEEQLDALVADLRADWDMAALEDVDVAGEIIAMQYDLWYADGEDTFWRNVPERWEEGLAGFERIGAVSEGLDPERFYTNDPLDEALGR